MRLWLLLFVSFCPYLSFALSGSLMVTHCLCWIGLVLFIVRYRRLKNEERMNFAPRVAALVSIVNVIVFVAGFVVGEMASYSFILDLSWVGFTAGWYSVFSIMER
ncbi:MAG: hypothetical protein Q7P63_05470 [Verrucomicrobiota bacterium JB022]|nr:hypothetical protein [Verrucomicrobiota bacterium JB022]